MNRGWESGRTVEDLVGGANEGGYFIRGERARDDEEAILVERLQLLSGESSGGSHDIFGVLSWMVAGSSQQRGGVPTQLIRSYPQHPWHSNITDDGPSSLGAHQPYHNLSAARHT